MKTLDSSMLAPCNFSVVIINKIQILEHDGLDIFGLEDAAVSSSSLNGLPFSAVSPDKCLGVPALQSFHSRTHSDGAVQRFAVHTSINARKQYIQTNKFGFIVCQHC